MCGTADLKTIGSKVAVFNASRSPEEEITNSPTPSSSRSTTETGMEVNLVVGDPHEASVINAVDDDVWVCIPTAVDSGSVATLSPKTAWYTTNRRQLRAKRARSYSAASSTEMQVI